MRAGLVPDIDVYDSAAWCSPVPLSVESLERGGQPVEVPDFTRGDWAKLRLGLDSVETDMPPGPMRAARRAVAGAAALCLLASGRWQPTRPLRPTTQSR